MKFNYFQVKIRVKKQAAYKLSGSIIYRVGEQFPKEIEEKRILYPFFAQAREQRYLMITFI